MKFLAIRNFISIITTFLITLVITPGIHAQITNNHQHLNINEVEAGINVTGAIHWDFNGYDYEVPKGSGNHTVIGSALWIGGIDASGQLHGSAPTYGLGSTWPGPIGSISIPFDSVSCSQFDYIWKIDKWKLEEFIHQFSIGNVTNGTYPIPQEIASWPAIGNGIVNNTLAPFIDFNGDGIYDAMDGDYPDILGDQMLYWIYNDALQANATGMQSMGIEVQAKAYAYNCTNIIDSNYVMNWTTLYHYTIINRSADVYESVYTGFWSDMDIGIASNDFAGCDTTRAAAFAYSYPDPNGYGPNPPMQNIKILRGTLADTGDGIDNDLDNTVDEPGERTTMNHFLSYLNANGTPVGNPNGGTDIYNYLRSIWLDNQPMTYGYDGRDPSAPTTNFMYSGVPYSTSGWTALNAASTPDDNRYLLSSGPVTMHAGDTLTFDIAYVFTWDSLSPNGLTTSVARNQADLDKVQYWFDTNTFPSCEVYSVGIPENAGPENITCFPNPAKEMVMVLAGKRQLLDHHYTIFNLQGAEVMNGKLTSGGINVSKLSPQPYIIRIDLPGGSVTRKLVKM